MEMKMENIYRTKDLYESSYLYACHKKLLQLDRENGRCWFIFQDKQSCQSLIDSYWRREAKIDAKEFIDALRSLKDRIFNNGDENEKLNNKNR